ncbi:VWA domain-containing protein [bacterium]|nr:VWA domain-containing protein [bacterium]
MRFANPWWFLLLVPVIGLGVLFWFRTRKPGGLRFPQLAGINKILPQKIVGSNEMLYGMVAAGMVLMTVAMARPQFGTTTEQISGKGVDVVVCLDTSGSMQSVDFKPQNRLGAAKEVAKIFIENRKRDRLGLVVFGGVAMTICPLTTDKRALLNLIDQVAIDMTGVDGTAVGMALATAAERLRESKAASKIIILLTDGRNNMGAIDPVTAAKAAAALGVKVYAIGAGSPQGGMMPVKDSFGRVRYQRVRNDLDETTLRKIAAATGGIYFRAKDQKGLESIFEKINRMEISDYKIVEFTNYRDVYFWWLALGLMLIGSAFVLQHTVFRQIP